MGGVRRFKPDEVLSAQQCTVLTSEGDGGDVAAEMESCQSDMCSKVLQKSSLKHPVVSGTFNLIYAI